MEQEDTDKKYMRMAFIQSEFSYAIRLKVGSIIVKDDRIISNGYNHQPPFLSKVCEFVKDGDLNRVPEFDDNEEIKYLRTLPIERLQSKSTVRHSESSALAKVQNKKELDGATIYVTHSPCVNCARALIQHGIKRVVYSINYRSPEGLKMLADAGITVDRIENCDF